jgi:hypothetical protein
MGHKFMPRSVIPKINIPFKPRIMPHAKSRLYFGEPSWARYYAKISPRLETIKIGRRTFVIVESADRLIDELIEESRRTSVGARGKNRQTTPSE